MTGNIAVFVTDQRQKNLAEYLPGKKVLLDWHNTQKKGAVEELVENCGYFIFPTPVSKLNRYPKLEDMLKYELINEKHEDKTVIGGAFTDKWIEYLQQHKISYFDLMKDENVVQKNAHITAQCVFHIWAKNYCLWIRQVRKKRGGFAGGNGSKSYNSRTKCQSTPDGKR